MSKRELRPALSLIAASALMIDYVMTVAVSTSSAVEQITSAVPELSTTRVLIGVVAIAPDHARQPARPARGRQHLRDPDLPVPRLGAADDRRRDRSGSWSSASAARTPTDRRSDRPRTRPDPVDHPPAARVRGRRRRPDRHRGDRDRRAGVPAARGEERRDDPGGDGRPARRPVHRHHVPRRRTSGSPISTSPRSRPSSARSPARVYGAGSIPFYLFQAFTALLLVLAANTSFNAFPRLARDPRRSTASCPASSRSAAIGSRSRYGIIVLATVAAVADRAVPAARPTC